MNLVLYDGQCGLCNKAVQLLLAIDRRRVLVFAPLQGKTAADPGFSRHSAQNPDSMIFISQARTSQQLISCKSDAVLTILTDVGGPWKIFVPLNLIPCGLRNTLYDWVARHRYAWFGKYEECKIPSANGKARFLP